MRTIFESILITMLLVFDIVVVKIASRLFGGIDGLFFWAAIVMVFSLMCLLYMYIRNTHTEN